jgi:hypothetical protein
LCIALSGHAQLVINTQFINPCGGDGQNEFVVAKTTANAVNIADVAFGSYNPSSNSNGTGGNAVVDYNYWWHGSNVANDPYPTFSNFPLESCGDGVSCFQFLYPSVTAENTDINTLIGQLNTTAGCNVFIPVPASNIIPANSNVVFFLGAGYRNASGLCGFDNLGNNINFSNHCNAGNPTTTYYAVFGNGNGAGPNCSNTSGGYFSNSSRRISVLHVFNGGDNTVAANYTTSKQDYTPGSNPAPGNAGLIIPAGGSSTIWVNDKGCVPPPDVIVAIKLTYFTGILKDKKAELKWESSFEEAIQQFIIEKSTDGRNFYPYIYLAPKNISGSVYTSSDAALANGYNFYRLKVINMDGSIDYSTVARINYTKGSASGWFIYPNPVLSDVSINYQATTPKNISLILSDAAGKLISKNTFRVVPGVNKLTVPAEKLSRGVYLAKVADGNNIETAVFIK